MAKFDVSVSKDDKARYCHLSVTHNGHQWVSLNFESRSEVERVIAELENFLRANNSLHATAYRSGGQSSLASSGNGEQADPALDGGA